MSIDKRNKDNVDLRSIEKIVRQSIVEIMNDTSVFDYSRKLPLADMGFDSVSFVDFKMHLAEQFDCELPSGFLFEHPNILSITEYFCSLTQSSLVSHSTSAHSTNDAFLSSDEDGILVAAAHMSSQILYHNTSLYVQDLSIVHQRRS